jgi:hypothetical protein
MDLSIIQFPHPGSEHRVPEDGWTSWNTKDHCRKFMINNGKYLTDNSQVVESDIVFWGEWEPPSERVCSWPAQGDLPKNLVRPRFPGEPAYNPGIQNTDPCIFGDKFRYTLCRQIKSGRATAMTRVAFGSMILFGSKKNNAFVLDLVFVVSEDIVPHSRTNWSKNLKEKISDTYRSVTMNPMYWDTTIPESLQFMMYEGTPYSSLESEIFSFFPCLPVSSTTEWPRFARPTIELPGIINPESATTFKKTILNKSEISEAWKCVVSQVREQGLELGISTVEPTLTEVPKQHWTWL